MKTRLIIIIGVSVGVLALLFFSSEEQNKCEQIGGTWKTDYCIITKEIFESNNVKCSAGTVLENDVCQSNGIRLVIVPVVEPSDHGGCEPDINGNTTWCGPTYDYWKILFSEPSAMLVVFVIPSLIVGIIIGVVFVIWRKRK